MGEVFDHCMRNPDVVKYYFAMFYKFHGFFNAAQLLKISISNVYELAQSKPFPAVRIGKRIVISRDNSICRWMCTRSRSMPIWFVVPAVAVNAGLRCISRIPD